ncbi:hypothetical protein MPWG_00058 [Micromonas pusilla virus PL1]|nr:hypothetical protein MPWG_00058 [Micromonas pusilla virus PL1]
MIPLIIVGSLAALVAYTYFGPNLISSEKAKEYIKSGKIRVVIDVRTAMEYRAGHYPRAIHIPVNKINKKQRPNFPKRVYSSTAILGNEPDLRQRNWKNWVLKMYTTSLGSILLC